MSADEGRGVSWLADRGVSASRRPAVTAIAQRAMAQDQVTWTDDEAWPGTTRARSRFAALALPLRCRGQIVGALVGLESRLPGGLPHVDLDEARLAPLHALLDGVAGALDNALRLKRAEALSVTDDLTRLYNSRFLDQVLRRETKRAVAQRPAAVAAVRRPRRVQGRSTTARPPVRQPRAGRSGGADPRRARETDIVARFGGDEFALVLPDTGREGRPAVAQRVRERIAGHPFLAADGVDFRLTASVGVATLPDVAASAEELVAAADAAMYRVKDRGKNGIRDGRRRAAAVQRQS